MTASRRLLWTGALLGLALTVGCGGYWSSNRTNSGQFAGLSSFEESEPFPIEIARLGADSPDTAEALALARAEATVESSTSRNKALLLAELGIGALYKGDLPRARTMLDAAAEIMLSVTQAGAVEERATSMAGSESDKYFKGEPYERALVLFYRGLVYAAQQDVENAHANFQQAALQDAAAELEIHRGDWLGADLLALYCKQRLRTTDRREWADFIRERYADAVLPPGFEQIGEGPILVFGAGLPPQKVAGEAKGQELQWARRPSRVARLRVAVDRTRPVEFSDVDDVYTQALTRGTRSMDRVLGRQANVKSGVETFGAVVMFTGAAVGGVVPGAQLVGGVVKELSWSVSDMVDSSADIRQISLAPGKLFVVPLPPSAGGATYSIEAIGEDGRVLAASRVAGPVGARDILVGALRF